MPNHITSCVIISGEKQEVEELKEFVSSKDGVFDFSKIVIPPDDPAYNDLPSQSQAKISPNWWYHWNRKNWGTKWNCYEVSMGLTVDMLKAYRIGLPYVYLNNKQSKILELLLGNDKSLLLGLEFVKEVEMPQEYSFLKQEIVAYSFQTAWSMPDPVFKKLSYKFPNLKFIVLYADENIGSNCGISIYASGVCNNIFESVWENRDYEKEEYQKFACILNNYDWDEYNLDE